MEIIISGSECEDKLIFFDTVQRAAMELGLDASVIKSDENAYTEISMPRLQIDGRIVWSGRPLTLAEAKDILVKNSDIVSCPCGANYYCRCE